MSTKWTVASLFYCYFFLVSEPHVSLIFCCPQRAWARSFDNALVVRFKKVITHSIEIASNEITKYLLKWGHDHSQPYANKRSYTMANMYRDDDPIKGKLRTHGNLKNLQLLQSNPNDTGLQLAISKKPKSSAFHDSLLSIIGIFCRFCFLGVPEFPK